MKYTSAQLRKHKSGWRGLLRYKGPDGAWHTRSKVLESTGKREARQELAEWRAEMEDVAAWEVPGSKRPGDVAEFVAQYIDTLDMSGAVEPSSVSGYRQIWKHILGAFPGTSFDALDSESAQAWVNGLVADGYAPSTVRKTLNLLKAAYKDAVARRLIPYSPIDAVRAPKLPRREPNSLDKSQRARLLAFLDVAGDSPVNLAVRIALGTGMREAEVCGLRWRDVDLNAASLTVRNVIARGESGTYEKEPKTSSSRRDIPLPDELVSALRRRRANLAEECMDAGVMMTPAHYVIGKVDGTYEDPHHLWSQWRAIAKSLNLVGTEGRIPTFHDLRHTFATAAIAAGADVKSVASIMGHSNVAMTLNVYASADAEAKRQAMSKAAAAISEAPRPAEILRIADAG